WTASADMHRGTPVLFIFVLFFFSALLPAQTLTGSISGTVRDEQGGVLPGASVTLLGKTGAISTTTDKSGAYRFPALNPGRYEMTVTLAGFQSWREPELVVSLGSRLTLA